ncbi:Domain of unknown function (DUF2935)-containing protein [uncultured virus]|nr:Domain of unknown function (DUF2935)-containing protein [uncultured virus]
MSESKSAYRTYGYHHKFWLQILGDHCRMIKGRLHADEKELLETADKGIESADQALALARDQNGSFEVKVAREVLDYVVSFKKVILSHILENSVKITLPPTFINHMLNEAERYEELIAAEEKNEEVPRLHVLDQHKLWLKDGEGHAQAIKDELDPVEALHKKTFCKSKKEFCDLYAKTEEFIGYLRTGTSDFPALRLLNRDAELKTQLFVNMLKEVQELKDQGAILTITDPLVLDHMLREEAYYLEGIADSLETEVVDPVYDPLAPRKE